MVEQIPSHNIKRLTYKVVKSMMGRTGIELKVPVKFVKAYKEACRRRVGINDEFEDSNLELRQHVRDNLMSHRIIFLDHKDVDTFYITQKAIDEYITLKKNGEI